jgi:hypothetical protein
MDITLRLHDRRHEAENVTTFRFVPEPPVSSGGPVSPLYPPAPRAGQSRHLPVLHDVLGPVRAVHHADDPVEQPGQHL